MSLALLALAHGMSPARPGPRSTGEFASSPGARRMSQREN